VVVPGAAAELYTERRHTFHRTVLSLREIDPGFPSSRPQPRGDSA
jgi:hypothetical protein